MESERDPASAYAPPASGSAPNAGRDGSGRNGFKPLSRQIAELREHLSLYASAQLDKGKLAVRDALILAILGVLGFVLAASLIATSAVLILNGFATALGRLFDDRSWLGAVLVGLVTLVLIGVGIVSAIAIRAKSDRQKTVEKYESLRTRQ